MADIENFAKEVDDANNKNELEVEQTESTTTNDKKWDFFFQSKDIVEDKEKPQEERDDDDEKEEEEFVDTFTKNQDDIYEEPGKDIYKHETNPNLVESSCLTNKINELTANPSTMRTCTTCSGCCNKEYCNLCTCTTPINLQSHFNASLSHLSSQVISNLRNLENIRSNSADIYKTKENILNTLREYTNLRSQMRRNTTLETSECTCKQAVPVCCQNRRLDQCLNSTPVPCNFTTQHCHLTHPQNVAQDKPSHYSTDILQHHPMSPMNCSNERLACKWPEETQTLLNNGESSNYLRQTSPKNKSIRAVDGRLISTVSSSSRNKRGTRKTRRQTLTKKRGYCISRCAVSAE